jgi:ribonuclease Z
MTQLRLIFLGTGGSWPTVKRNVSSVAVKRGSEIILFDCGEGTQRQFQLSNLSYMQISKIFITHFHGDHFLGIPGLVQTMQLNDRNEPLHLYGPEGMDELANQLLTLGYFRPSYKIIAHTLTDDSEVKFEGYSIHAMKNHHNVPGLSYCLQEHQRPGRFNKSKALKLGIPEGPLFSKLQKGHIINLPTGKKITPDMVLGPSRKGRKIVLSGDTKPSEKMIAFSQEADVLIHEATFDSRLKDIAKDYGHTTALQAAEIAKDAKVEKLFLVHISPRYLDYHIIEDEARTMFAHSYVPRDFQEVEVKLKN